MNQDLLRHYLAGKVDDPESLEILEKALKPYSEIWEEIRKIRVLGKDKGTTDPEYIEQVIELENSLGDQGFFITEEDEDEYVLGRSDKVLSDTIMGRMERDPVFRTKLEKNKKALKWIRSSGRDNLKKKLIQIEADLEKTQFFITQTGKEIPLAQRYLFKRRWFINSAAALIIILIGLFFIVRPFRSNEKAFDEFYTLELFHLENDLLEARKRGFADPEIDKKLSRESILEAMQNHQYEEVIRLANQHLELYADDILVRHYLGLALVDNGNYDQAINQFATVIQETDFQYMAEAKWYAGLSYLKLEDGCENARSLFTQLRESQDNMFRQLANSIISHIEC